jgi:hypothetical protein
MNRVAILMVVSACLACSTTKDSRQRTMDVRYLAQSDGKTEERSRTSDQLNATLILGAQLSHKKAVDLLRAAETPEGGSPSKLLRAGRTLVAGEGVVLLGTVRGDATGGSATTVTVFQIAVECASANVDQPGALKDCNGYVMRVPRTWPAEVYDVSNVTLSILPESGVATGRINAKSTGTSTFSVAIDGEFAATIAEFTPAQAAATPQ